MSGSSLWQAVCIVFFLSCLEVYSQQTFSRTCNCEYFLNGQCAYIASSDPDNVCSSMDNSAYDALEATMEILTRNLTAMTEHASAQSELLVQLQGTMSELQVAVQQPCQECLSMQSQVDSHDTSITSMQGTISELSENILQVSQTLESTSQTLIDSTSTLTSEVTALQQQYSEVATNMTMLEHAVMNVARNYWLCHQKGLLVSGNMASIEDTAINASSDISNTITSARINSTSAWCPAEPNTEEWLQFDFGQERPVFGLVTLGRFDYTQWVTSYKMSYTTEAPSGNTNWTVYTDILGAEQIFAGNIDQNSLQTNMLWQPILARAVRIHPLSAEADSNQCMRADIIGCVDSMP